MKKITTILALLLSVSIFSNENLTINEFTTKLSIEGVINTGTYNLSSIKRFEEDVLKLSKEEQLLHISDTDVSYFLDKMYINIVDDSSNIDHIYSYEVLDEEIYSKSVWAAYGQSINQEYILDKVENYDEFKKLKLGDVKYYSFRLKNSETGELYLPLYFYLDSNSIIITGYEEILKKILTNTNKVNYFTKADENLLHIVNIVDFNLYREHGYGIIESIDFDNSFDYIKSLEYHFTKKLTGKITLDIQFTGENEQDTLKIKDELEKLKLDIIKKIANVKNDEMNKFCESIKISSKNNIITVKVDIPVPILNILRFNIISSLTDLFEVFPSIVFDSWDQDYGEITDTLATNNIKFKEEYNYRMDFENSSESNARLDTKVEITEIGYVDNGENLYINLQLTTMAGKELSWQYKYLDFGIKNVNTNTGNIKFSEDYEIDKLPVSKNVGESEVIEQTIVFPKGIKHSDIKEITTLFTFLEPKVVKKIVITRDDINKTMPLGSGLFTLLSFDRQFIYSFIDMKDSLIEVRALNKNGEALYSSGGGTRWIKFNNGLQKSRMSPIFEGNIESVELYYVSEFNKSKIDMPHAIDANLSDITPKENSKEEPFEVVVYNPNENQEALPVDDFFESDIDRWQSAKAGPFDIYLRGISEMWELELELYLKAPDHPAFKNSLSGFELTIDNITTNSGDIIKRPNAETLKHWELENNTFDKSFSWILSKPFHDLGDITILRDRLVLGVPNEYQGLKSFNGHIVFTIPQSVTSFNIKNLLVGDKITDPNIELEVIEFKDGKYNLKINKGQKNLVQIRVKDSKSNQYKVLDSKLVGDILTVDPISKHEVYEVTISTKNLSYEYAFNIEI